MHDPSTPAGQGLHTPLIKSRIPEWIEHLTPANIQAMDQARDPARQFIATYPQQYTQASPALRQALLDSQAQSTASGLALAKTLKDFKGITDFAKPLLVEAMRKKFGQTPDVNRTLLYHLIAPYRSEKQSLLQAALRNFEADEPFDKVVLQETSALAPEGALEIVVNDENPNYPFNNDRFIIHNKLSIKPAEFASLCRELDLGKQYQDHLSATFDASYKAAQVRRQTIAANKDRMRLQAHIARMRSSIDETAYVMLMAILNDMPQAKSNAASVAYSRLQVFGTDLSDILIIGAGARKLRKLGESPWALPVPLLPDLAKLLPDTGVIVYIPGDPLSPFKQYASLSEFSKALAINLRSVRYQRFFAGFVPPGESARFFHRLKNQLKVYRWNPNPVYPGPPYNPQAFRDGIYEEVWNAAADLAMDETFIDGEVFSERYNSHLARMKADALLLAIPTAEVDHKAWIERLKHYAEWGLNVLNVAAFFVPGLGEVMMAVTVGQLSLEVYHGVEAWQQGDAEEAWTHLKSVLQNVAFIAALGVIGAKAGTPPLIKGSNLVDGMQPVKLPNGQVRLWKPDLAPYESDVLLSEADKPDAQGEYSVNGRSYIRLDGKFYEKHFDSQISKWRLQHPTDREAYQPILHHNGQGAWRHSLERSLAWDRPTLLRRMGHVTEPFSDEVLAHIADVSGVSDDALRAMHIDHQPPTPLLAETLNQFKIHQQVNTLVEQVRTGNGIANYRADLVLPLLVDMPRWPFGRVIEVFDGSALEGKSTRYGVASSPAKPSIKVSMEQVSNGQLPESVLSALDEPEITRLLGGQSPGAKSERIAEFSKQLADHLNTQKAAIFTRIEKGTTSVVPEFKVLQRANPGLPDSVARQLLSEATELERLSLSKRQRVPLAMAEKARGFMQQVRLNRAFAGLSLDSLASLDSDRVALHALEHLPGWQGKVRLEIREVSVEGRLVDSIGSDTAPERKCLVIRDNQFQAYDAEGNTLNSVPSQGRNYFSSILHALPDGVRRDLAIPHVGQSADLQKVLTEYAIRHRSEMSRALKQQPPRRGFRGPEQGASAYGLSGRGAGAQVGYNASLVARVRDIYPNLTEEMAGRFVSDQMLSGRSDQQIFTLLNNRSREFEALTTTLDGWVGPEAGPTLSIERLNRRIVADRLIHCWRLGLHRNGYANVNLDLSGASDLPLLAADFSHVKEIKLGSTMSATPAAGELLSQFPNLRSVRLTIAEGARLPPSVTAATGLGELHLEGWELGHSAELQTQLNGMTQLQTLSIRGKMEGIDVSRLVNLRNLDLSFCQLQRWPPGILQLNHLQEVNLWGNPISRLPQALFNAHEPLWRGLTIDWSTLEHESFMSAYRYVLSNPAHLADAEQMAIQYRRGSLRSRVPESEQASFELRPRDEGVTTAILLEQIGELRREEDQLVRQLDEWKGQSNRVERIGYDGDHRQVVADRLLTVWRFGVSARWGVETRGHIMADVLDISGGLLSDLPILPPAAYSRVRALNLRGTLLAQDEMNRLLTGLPQLQNLDLRYNSLHEIPTTVGELRLKILDLSHNDLTITPALQDRLSTLTTLENLSLSHNRVGMLDVSGMTSLRSLDLSSTAVTRWPTGVLGLPNLRSLNFNNSGITSFPQPITAANELLLAATQVRGCRLTDQAIAVQLDVSNRVRARIGLPPVPAPPVADRSRPQILFEPDQPFFYPDLDAVRAESVLPDLPAEVVPGEPALTAHERLRRLDPDMNQAMAQEIVEGLEGQGLTPTQVDARITQWRQASVTMRNTLNTWINSRVYGEAGRGVSQLSRRRAADSILWCWRREVLAGAAEPVSGGGVILDLTDLRVGDLPALPQPLTWVHTLKLGSAGISEQGSNGFLNSFPRLRNLVLDQNRLDSLPDAVTGMRDLTRLQLRYNELLMSETLQRQLNSLPALKELDLGNNRLLAFDVSAMPRLERLNLEGNNLAEWPTGMLQVPGLRALNLSRNRLTTIPEALWDRQRGPSRGPYVNTVLRHDRLISGLDISDNPLSHEAVSAILDCSQEYGHRLGYSQQELEGNASDEDGMSDEEEASADESLGEADNESEDEQLTRWLSGDAPNAAARRAVWERLKAQADNEAFFHLLAQLKETADFARTRADLTERVWQVMEAADRNEQLRELLFVAARSPYTCGDGRILLFSDLEVQVLVFNTEQSVETGQQGAALLGLAKQLFRLDKVKAIADARVRANPGTDPAEIRLAYRRGLANRLQLPNQPRDMLYEGIANISAADLETAFKQVTAAEQTDELAKNLAERTFWSDYLKKTYPQRFTEFQQQQDVEYNRLDELHPDFNDVRELAMLPWSIDKKVAELALKIELTGLERTKLGL